jgi:hypothetical protein
MAEDEAGSEPTASDVPTPGQPPTPPAPSSPVSPADPDATVATPSDATALTPPVKAGPDGTSVMPAVTPPGPEAPRWSARAQVRSPGGDPTADDWEESIDQPGPGVLTPMLITLGVLLLLGLVGVGVWLVLRDQEVAPVGPTTSSAATTVPTTSAAPTTTTTPPPTTTAPPPTGAVAIPVPDVAGATFADAAEALGALGLIVQREDRSSAEVPAGQVIGTNPPKETLVVPGIRITVFVSTGPPTTQPPTTGPTTTPPS